MHCLVVCGTAQPDTDADAALFGDFLGLSMALQYLHGDATGNMWMGRNERDCLAFSLGLQPKNRFVASPCTAMEEHWTSGRCRNMTFAPGFVDCIRDPSMSISELCLHLQTFLAKNGFRRSNLGYRG